MRQRVPDDLAPTSLRCGALAPARFASCSLACPDTDRRAFREGARDYSPTLMAIFSWGLVTGIAMSKSVLTLPQALTMSLLCYAGSSQLAVLPLLAAKLPIWTVLLTAAMVNTRFVIFSVGLAPHFSYLPMWRRIVLGYFNGDVIYLLFQKKSFPTGYVPGKEPYYWGMAVCELAVVAGVVDCRHPAREPDSR